MATTIRKCEIINWNKKYYLECIQKILLRMYTKNTQNNSIFYWSSCDPNFWFILNITNFKHAAYYIIFNLQLLWFILSQKLGRDGLIMRPSIWTGPIHTCNNILIFWAFFNFDLKGINVQNWYLLGQH